jgi:hypothetical protein
MTTENQLCEQFKNIIKKDSWYNPTIKELAETDFWASTLVSTFLDRHNIGWSISTDRANGNSFVIKIDDKRLRYMLIMPQGCHDKSPCDQFYWMVGDDPNNDDHGIHVDQASAYLMAKEFPGIKVIDERQEDGSCLTTLQTPDGRETVVHFPAALFDNKRYRRQ